MSGCTRFFARRTAIVADPARQAVWSCATSTVIGLRHAARRPARATAAAPHKRKSSAKSSSKVDGAGAATATAPHRARQPAVTSKESEAEEKGLAETDARLSMRLLMTSHFNYTGEAAKMVKQTRQSTRVTAEEHQHDARQRRLLEKDDNAMRLLAADGGSVGDGIIPLAGAASRNPHTTGAATVAGGGGGGAAAAWRALNPVGLAASQAVAAAALPGDAGPDADDTLSENAYAEFLATRRRRDGGGADGDGDGDGTDGEDVDADPWKSATLATLSKPDLSVYDTDRDFRMSSEEALRLAQGQPSAEAAADVYDTIDAESGEGADAAKTLLTRPGASRLAAAAMRQKLEEDEDADYTVAAYAHGADDPLSL